MDIKIIANYLPQFHETEENDKWWGKGYTDWNAVKKSKSLFSGHRQPKVPLNDNYYDLSDINAIKWQAGLANRYGIYGFAMYHYWFHSDMHLLEKPSEIILANEDINIHICFIWDNSTWKRTWSNVRFGNDWGSQNLNDNADNSSDGILAELIYGDEKEWKIHFDYLLTFFKDNRYIKVGNRPVFGVFNQDNGTETLKKMFSYWDSLAKENGFDGMYILGKKNHHGVMISDYQYEYEPLKHGWLYESFCGKVYQRLRTGLHKKFNFVDKYNYDSIWINLINEAKISAKKDIWYGAFVGYDDTPRRGAKGKVVVGSTPDKFEYYLKKLISISKEQGKEFIFLTAWNEWGEGAYLEPDTRNGYAYLEAVNNALNEI